MIEYFRLSGPDSERLLASDTSEDPPDITLCPITKGLDQHRSIRRIGDLALEVKHTHPDQWLIWAWVHGMVVHARLLEEFEKRGFTGYRLRPATVRFRHGYLSRDYSELVVTGWAGIAPPESGIRLVKACTACGYKKYSSLEHPEKLIDWTQWTGEDFFMVWPLPKYTLITKRVANALAELKVNSYCLESMLTPPQWPFSIVSGYTVGALSQFMPEDLAIRYGKPLGLECEPGCWPAAEAARPSGIEEPAVRRIGRDETAAKQLSTKIRSLKGTERQAAIAALFDLARGEGAVQYEVSHECLTLLRCGELKPEEASPYAPALLAIWNSAQTVLSLHEPESMSAGRMFDDDYCRARAVGEVVLDVLGYVPGCEVGSSLHAAVTLDDPRLKTWAILSLLRRGERVDPAQIEQVAASLEMRMIFWRQLKQIGRQSLMPERWSRPEQLAASDLSQWASHPNELGVPPSEVELMMKFPLKSADGPTDEVYLFRFREYPKPWEPGEGWMAGIAGPIRNGESQGSPWSSFKKWDSMSPDQHFDNLFYRGSACPVC